MRIIYRPRQIDRLGMMIHFLWGIRPQSGSLAESMRPVIKRLELIIISTKQMYLPALTIVPHNNYKNGALAVPSRVLKVVFESNQF